MFICMYVVQFDHVETVDFFTLLVDMLRLTLFLVPQTTTASSNAVTDETKFDVVCCCLTVYVEQCCRNVQVYIKQCNDI